jgi:hypothetical protein
MIQWMRTGRALQGPSLCYPSLESELITAQFDKARALAEAVPSGICVSNQGISEVCVTYLSRENEIFVSGQN